MPLSAGTRLGSYEILAPLGAGGMGEVYRATDTKLRREVAIKILPTEVAGDPERLARFQREAHLLASLNHPNIASIHGLEEAEGQPFLVLELSRDGHVDDLRQIDVRNRRPHEGLKLLQLVSKLGAGPEAHLVTPGSQDLHDRGPSWGGVDRRPLPVGTSRCRGCGNSARTELGAG